MKILFSPTTLAFYLEGINDPIPADAIEVTAEQRNAAVQAANMPGMRLAADKLGMPLAEAAVTDPEDQRAALRRRRDQALRGSDWTQLPDSPLTKAQRGKWAAWRQLLRDLPDDAAALPEPPALKS